MSSFGRRVKEKREYLGLSQEELASLLGYSDKSSISKIENNQRDITRGKILEFARVLDTTPAYLMGWEEDKSINKKTAYNPLIKTTVNAMQNMNNDGKEQVADYATLLDESGKYKLDEPQPPLTLSEEYLETYTDAQAAAGAGAYNYGYDDGSYIRIRKSDVPDYDAIIDIRGDSMYPTIETGDVAFIDFNFDCKDGKIYIVQHDDETYIKRCYFENNKLIMKSDNPEYEDIVFKNSELEQVRVIGVVIDWATPEK